ncbi:hypothetical protein PM082_002521 [Marasmius tenuissimus]|nr:hypothetical protein PM082_002521 [Marasmius tenuissimus]
MPIKSVPGNQPKPSKNHFFCNCHKKCGGPEGVGMWVSKSSRYRHRKAEATYRAWLNADAESSNSANVPMTGALPFTSADDAESDADDADVFGSIENEPTGGVESMVLNTPDNDDILMNNPTSDPGGDPFTSEPRPP